MSKILVLDKGHGGTNSSGVYDPGACGNCLQEADLVDDICNRIAAKLEPYDVQVEFAPRSDSLTARAQYANDLGADYFCSVHINGGCGTGFESYVYTDASEASKTARSIIHDEIAGWLAKQGIVDRGKKAADFTVLAKTTMPAVLLENLFIDTAADAAKLADPDFRDGLANAIAYGLVMAMGLQKKVVSVPEQWKLDIISEAKNAGLITEDHDPDETAPNWLVLKVALTLLKLFNIRK